MESHATNAGWPPSFSHVDTLGDFIDDLHAFYPEPLMQIELAPSWRGGECASFTILRASRADRAAYRCDNVGQMSWAQPQLKNVVYEWLKNNSKWYL